MPLQSARSKNGNLMTWIQRLATRAAIGGMLSAAPLACVGQSSQREDPPQLISAGEDSEAGPVTGPTAEAAAAPGEDNEETRSPDPASTATPAEDSRQSLPDSPPEAEIHPTGIRESPAGGGQHHGILLLCRINRSLFLFLLALALFVFLPRKRTIR